MSLKPGPPRRDHRHGHSGHRRRWSPPCGLRHGPPRDIGHTSGIAAEGRGHHSSAASSQPGDDFERTWQEIGRMDVRRDRVDRSECRTVRGRARARRFTLRVGYQPYYAEAWAGGVVRAMSADETPLRLSVESPQGRCRRSVSRPATRALRTVGTRAVQSRARLRASRASALLRTAPTAQHQGAEQSRTEERQRAGLGDLGQGRGHLKARVERAGE